MTSLTTKPAVLTKHFDEAPVELSVKERLLAALAYGLSLLLALTYRVQFVTPLPEQNHCLALRHENLFAALICLRGRSYAPLASLSKDGSLIAYVLEKLGYPTIRGSSSKGGEAARELLTRVVSSGFRPAITVDGPRGPRRRVKGGVVDVARRTATPVVAVVALGNRNWVFAKSWDRFKLPKPFATIYIAFSDPIAIAAETKGLAFGTAKQQVAQALNACEQQAIGAGGYRDVVP